MGAANWQDDTMVGDDVEALRNDIRLVVRGFVRLDERVSELRSDFLQEMKGLRGESVGLTREITALRKESTGLAHEFTALRRESTGFAREITALRQESTGLAREITALREESTGLAHEFTALRQESTGLAREITALREESTGLVREVMMLRKQFDSHVQIVADHFASIGERIVAATERNTAALIKHEMAVERRLSDMDGRIGASRMAMYSAALGGIGFFILAVVFVIGSIADAGGFWSVLDSFRRWIATGSG